MLGTTIDRNGVRQDVDNNNYTYSPDRPVPSFDARYGRKQDMYDVYAPAESVMQQQRQYQTPQTNPMFQQPTVNPNNVSNRADELWNRLETNNVSRNSIESNMNFMPGESAPYAPIKLREAQPRQATHRTSKKLSTQGKVILAVYLAVVLLIVTLVIVNAEMINSPAPAPEAEPGAAQVSLFEENERGLSFEKSPYNSPNEQTNWFDDFLDKMGD